MPCATTPPGSPPYFKYSSKDFNNTVGKTEKEFNGSLETIWNDEIVEEDGKPNESKHEDKQIDKYE